jgi:LAO/AO transport system kinase
MIDLGPHTPWRPPVIETVATSGTGVAELWAAVKAHRGFLESSGELAERRRTRLSKEIATIAAERVRYRISADASPVLEKLVARVERREIDPQAAAAELLTALGLV